jgi:hypothetical protein
VRIRKEIERKERQRKGCKERRKERRGDEWRKGLSYNMLI